MQIVQKRFRLRSAFAFAACLAIAFVMVVPFVWMLSASFKSNVEVFEYPVRWIPRVFRFESYQRVWNDIDFPLYYLNTLKVAVVTTAVQLLTSSLAAFSFSKLRFPGRDKLFFGYIATMMVPWHAIMIPQFLVVRTLGFYDNHAALIALQAFSAFGVFVLRQNMISIPDSLHEAARIDGCGPLRTYWHIVMPLTRIGLATLTILTFNFIWNDYMAPMIYLESETLWTIQLGLALFRKEFISDYGAIMAGTVCSIIPIVIVYIFAQKYIIEGVAYSGVKG